MGASYVAAGAVTLLELKRKGERQAPHSSSSLQKRSPPVARRRGAGAMLALLAAAPEGEKSGERHVNGQRAKTAPGPTELGLSYPPNRMM